MLLNGSIYKLMVNGCSSTNSRYFGARLTKYVGPGSEKLWGLHTWSKWKAKYKWPCSVQLCQLLKIENASRLGKVPRVPTVWP